MHDESKGEIVLVVTSVGEIVGKLLSIDAGSVELDSPRMIGQTQDGIGFAPGLGMFGKPEPKRATIQLAQVVAITEPHQSIADSWRQLVSGIVVSSKQPNIVGINGARKQ